VAIARVPAGESVLSPRSRCPQCESEITLRDNIPILSWVLLRARCRHCGLRISIVYPLVEVGTALSFVLVTMAFDPGAGMFAYWVFAAGLITVSGIDFTTRRIPTVVLMWIMALGTPLLLLSAVLAEEPWRMLRALIAALGSYAVFRVIHAVSPAGMGYGDVRFSFVLGFFLGWLGAGYAPLGLFLGFLSGSVVGLILIAVAGKGKRTHIPFGPHLALGAFVAVLLGDTMLTWYLG
jgi:leader peptidase (prepilin peptidase) / N-methyltransferase